MFKTTTITAPVEITIGLDDELKCKIEKITELQIHTEELISSYDKKLLKSLDYVMSNEAFLKEKMFSLDEKMIQYEYITRKIEATSKEIISNNDKYNVVLHSLEEYFNEYHKIIQDLPTRDYIDVFGEKILVTKQDAMKSPILARVLNTKHKILDLICPTIFKEILEIIREFPIKEEKFKDLIRCEQIIKNMKKIKIDPNVYPFLHVRMFNESYRTVLSTEINYVIGEPNKFDNLISISGRVINSTKIRNKCVYVQHTSISLTDEQIYYTFPKLSKINIQEFNMYIGCSCNKTGVHLHKYNNLIKEENTSPIGKLILWYKINVVDVDGNPISS
jgi:hypothetical protein